MPFARSLSLIADCWILFAVVWLIAAFATKRTVFRQNVADRLRYSILLVLAYFITTRARFLPFPLNLHIVPHRDLSATIGVCLCLAGLLFAFWARFSIGRNWSGTITLKEEHELVERGPYRFVRHPIYTGILVMFVGTVLAIGRVGGIIGLALMLTGFWIKLRAEEQLMEQQFGPLYTDYSRRVKRLVPFVF